MLSKTSLLGVSVTTSSREAILSRISSFLSVLRPQRSVIQIVTPNPEQIVLAQHNEKFRTTLNTADIALPDGAGVVWALKYFYSVIPAKARPPARQAGILLGHGIPAQGRNDKQIKRIPGLEFMIDLLKLTGEKNKRVLLYGSRGGVAHIAFNKVKETIPDLDGLVMDGGEIDGEIIPKKIIDEIVHMIRGRNISVIFIGLGAPKQEFVMHALATSFASDTVWHRPLVFMAVGGSFDVLAGKITRAPKVVQQLGFEWLWRLFQEPWRWRRQRMLLQFIWLVFFKNILHTE